MKRILSSFMFLALCVCAMAQAKVKVACVGNSITFGSWTPNPATDAYPAQLQVLLGDKYEVRNFGRSGATLLNHGHKPYTKTEEFRQAIDFKADIVVIHLGVNDTDPRNWPNYRDEFIPDYMALIDSFRVARPGCRIVISRLSPLGVHHARFESGTRDWEWEEQDAIEQVAKNSNVELMDFHSLLYAYPNLLDDSVHPSKEGHSMMAKYVYSVLTGDFGGLQLAGIYTDNMVLQHGKPLAVHGLADVGQTVKVSLYRQNGDAKAKGKRKKTARTLIQQKSAVASNLGQWEVELDPIAAGGPYVLEVADGAKTLAYDNVLAGEVWICSGQSNMAFMLNEDLKAKQSIAEAANPLIRLYNMKPLWLTNHFEWSPSALDSLNHLEYYAKTQWEQCTPETAEDFSAVGYYFGKMLADSLQVPVGLVCTAVGGACTETFIDRKTLEFEFPAILRNWLKNDFIQDWVRNRGAKNIAQATVKYQRHPYEPCFLFESSTKVLDRYGVNGVIWYQGESNAHNWDTHTKLFQLLLKSWRGYWNNPDLPFYYVQLSSMNRPSWTWFRDSQRRLLDVTTHTGMAVTHDVGHPTNVHPTDKQTVGERLARLALHDTYGKSCTPCGPLYKSMQIKDGKAVLSFTYGDGLKGKDGKPVIGFEVSGGDGLWHQAEVEIQDDKVVVWSNDVTTPKKVRYAWRPYTEANLVNADNLPASTFLAE